MSKREAPGILFSELLVLVGYHAQQAAPYADRLEHDHPQFMKHLKRIEVITDALTNLSEEVKTMSETTAEQPVHFVTVTAGEPDSDGSYPPASLAFECRDPEGKCHTYPDCDCESWNEQHCEMEGPGHEMVHHAECLIQGWFAADCAVYIGPDAEDWDDNGVPRGMTRAGFITTSWDECAMWEFVEEGPDE